MNSQNKTFLVLNLFALLFFILFINADKQCFAQNNQSGEKGFDNPAFMDDKPVVLGTAGAETPKKTKVVVAGKIIVGRKKAKSKKPQTNQPNYVLDASFPETILGKGNEYIGFTFWRVGKANSNNTKDLVDESNYQRQEDNTRLEDGDMIKLMFSSSRNGFLYLINYELRTDGSRGKARLIFPTLKHFNGDNYIKALFPFIPPPKDGFTVRNRTQEAGKIKEAEVLIIIISPQKLDLPKPLSQSAMELSEDEIRNLLNGAIRLESKASLKDGVGQKPTEKERSVFNSKDLVDESNEQDDSDAVPQNLLMGAAKSNVPIWIKIKLLAKH